MKHGLVVIAMLVCGTLSAQFGVSAFYNANNLTETAVVELGSAFDFPLENGYEVQLNYWFRLPEKRVEFQPTVYYNSAGVDINAPNQRYHEVGFQFEVSIYPFDFGGDCDCPTFGKQGPHLEKGFFVQVFPGIARRTVAFDTDILDNINSVTFVYGGGIGLDIGITNFLTLTPTLSLRQGSSPYNSSEFEDVNGVTVKPLDRNLYTYQAGLQATFRFDHKRY